MPNALSPQIRFENLFVDDDTHCCTNTFKFQLKTLKKENVWFLRKKFHRHYIHSVQLQWSPASNLQLVKVHYGDVVRSLLSSVKSIPSNKLLIYFDSASMVRCVHCAFGVWTVVYILHQLSSSFHYIYVCMWKMCPSAPGGDDHACSLFPFSLLSLQ